MVGSEELIGTTECLSLQTRCRLNRCRYNRVRLYLNSVIPSWSAVLLLPVAHCSAVLPAH